MSKDLLGHDTPDPPPMADPLPWRIFQMNDYEWWCGRTLQEVKEAYARDQNCTVAELEEGNNPLIYDVAELSDEDMDRLKFNDTEEDDDTVIATRTFREQLALRLSEGMSEPELFAGTEW